MRPQIILFAIASIILCCPDQPSDILLIIKATYYLSDSQWEMAKSLTQKIANSLNIGRTKSNSQMSVYLYDTLSEPKGIIEMGAYGRSSDLLIALGKMNQLPCGSWCGAQTQKSDVEQISSILSKQVFTRPSKILIISADYIDTYGLQALITTTPRVLIQQVQIPQLQVAQPQPYYNYYQAYYDNYRRYAGRYEQIYPYMHVQVPSQQYPYYPRCEECLAPSASAPLEISTNLDAKNDSINSGDSKSQEAVIIKPSKQDAKHKAEGVTEDEDYEYEITADPPGLKINKTPLLDEVHEKSIKDEYELQQ